MNIKRYNVRSLSLKERCVIGGGYHFLEIIWNYIEAERVSTIMGFAPHQVLPLPNRIYVGEALLGHLEPFSFAGAPKAENFSGVTYKILGKADAEMEFAGPISKINTFINKLTGKPPYVESIENYCKNTGQELPKFPEKPFKFVKTSVTSTHEGEGIVRGVLQCNGEPITNASLFLGAFVKSRRLYNELMEYMSWFTNKRPEIKLDDLHDQVKDWAKAEDLFENQKAKLAANSAQHHAISSEPSSSTLAPGFYIKNAPTSEAQMMELPLNTIAYIKKIRKWTKEAAKTTELKRDMPHYKGDFIYGVLEMKGFPNVAYILGEGDGLIKYCGVRDHIYEYIETDSKDNDIWFKVLKEEGVGENYFVEGKWLWKKVDLKGIEYVYEDPRLTTYGTIQEEKVREELYNYMVAKTDEIPKINSSCLYDKVRAQVRSEGEELVFGIRSHIEALRNSLIAEERKANILHQMPLFKGIELRGSLAIYHFPNIIYVIPGKGDGMIEYYGLYHEINYYIGGQQEARAGISFQVTDIKIRQNSAHVKGFWKSVEGQILEDPYLVIGGMCTKKKYEKIMDYIFARIDQMPEINSSCLHDYVREEIVESKPLGLPTDIDTFIKQARKYVKEADAGFRRPYAPYQGEEVHGSLGISSSYKGATYRIPGKGDGIIEFYGDHDDIDDYIKSQEKHGYMKFECLENKTSYVKGRFVTARTKEVFLDIGLLIRAVMPRTTRTYLELINYAYNKTDRAPKIDPSSLEGYIQERLNKEKQAKDALNKPFVNLQVSVPGVSTLHQAIDTAKIIGPFNADSIFNPYFVCRFWKQNLDEAACKIIEESLKKETGKKILGKTLKPAADIIAVLGENESQEYVIGPSKNEINAFLLKCGFDGKKKLLAPNVYRVDWSTNQTAPQPPYRQKETGINLPSLAVTTPSSLYDEAKKDYVAFMGPYSEDSIYNPSFIKKILREGPNIPFKEAFKNDFPNALGEPTVLQNLIFFDTKLKNEKYIVACSWDEIKTYLETKNQWAAKQLKQNVAIAKWAGSGDVIF